MASITKDDNIHDLKNLAQDTTARGGKMNLRDTAEKAGLAARNYLNTAYDEAAHTTEAVTSQIRRNPLQSSVIALGIGMVLGALFRRQG